MGAVGSREGDPVSDVSARSFISAHDDWFHESVLLVNAPPSLFGDSLGEGLRTLVDNVAFEVVRWDGGAMNTDKQRRAAGGHTAVVYFCDPTERFRADAEERFVAVLGQVLDTTETSTRIFACLYGAAPREERKIPFNFDPKDLVTALARTRPGLEMSVKDRVKIRYIYSESAWVQLLCDISLSVLPRKMSKPLSNLARDMAEATEATDVLLLHASTLLPILVCTRGVPEAEVPQRVTRIVKPLRDALLPFLKMSGGVELSSFEVEHELGFVCCRLAAAPDVHVVMVVQSRTPTGATGLALVKLNLAHYAMHFTNVIRNTNQRRNFNPILPED